MEKASIKLKTIKVRSPLFILSVPTKQNIPNIMLGILVEYLNPSLIGKIEFDLPIAIINQNYVEFPSIDIYYKKINKQDVVFFIGNHVPKNVNEFAEIVYSLFKKMNGKEIIVLTEIASKDDLALYFRYRKKRRKDKISKAIESENVKHIQQGIISGVGASLLKYNIPVTILFTRRNGRRSFMNNLKALTKLLNINFNEIQHMPLLSEISRRKNVSKIPKKELKKDLNRIKIGYIG